MKTRMLAVRGVCVGLLLAGLAGAAPVPGQQIPPLPRRLTSVDARLYEPLEAPDRDPFGYPANDIDKTALLALLEAGDHEGLERTLRELHERAQADVREELRLSSAYWAFDRADDALTGLLDGWVAARPASAEALLARARHRIALAWRSRGHEFLAETSAQQRAGMMEWAERAGADIAAASALAPDHMVALDLAFSVLAFGGWSEEHEQLLYRSNQLYPLNTILREAALAAAVPVWGGSWQRMEEIAAEAARHVEQNARLGVFRGYVLAERGRLAYNADDLPAAVHYFTQALEFGPDPLFLIGRGKAWLAARDYTRALADFADASYQLPQSPELLELRTHALFEIAQFAPPDIRDLVLDRAYEAATLLERLQPEREGVNALVQWITQVRAACRARSPQCRGRPGGP